MSESCYAASSFINQLANKGKDRPARTPHVAFMATSYYRLPIVFLLSKACRKGFSLFVRDYRMLYKNCFQQGLIVYPDGLWKPFLPHVINVLVNDLMNSFLRVFLISVRFVVNKLLSSCTLASCFFLSYSCWLLVCCFLKDLKQSCFSTLLEPWPHCITNCFVAWIQ